jgi:hypothetical protein
MFSGKEFSKWQLTRMFVLEREFFILYVMEVLNIYKKKFIKLFLNLTMIKTQKSEELATKLWLLTKEQVNGTFCDPIEI